MNEISVGLLSIISSALTAVFVMPWIMRREQKKDAQEQLLLRVLNTWLHPANPEYQAAIASIPITFAKCEEVLKRRDLLLAFVSNEEKQRELGDNFDQNAKELQASLLCAMGQSFGLSMDEKQLLQSAYVTKGYVDREVMLVTAYNSWPRIASAIERSNVLTERLLSPGAGKNED